MNGAGMDICGMTVDRYLLIFSVTCLRNVLKFNILMVALLCKKYTKNYQIRPIKSVNCVISELGKGT